MHTQTLYRQLALSAAGTLVFLLSSGSASASLVMTINGGPPIVGSGDHVSYISPSTDPNYSFNIQVGVSNDPGTSADGLLTLSSTVTRKSGGGVIPLTITVTDNGYTLPVSSLYTLTSKFSGSLTPEANGASESFTSSVSSPSLSTPVQGFSAPPGTVPVSSNSTDAISFAGLSHPYTLSESATIYLGPLASARITASTTLTPEPTVFGLLGVGSIGLLRRRRV